ncbi:phenylacetic acid degradation protein PaaY [Roseospira marina]|uniref:Phenylacetic acid degradation protein PaaY n=1 Tax=Roseospira marina TaxID=140057 RepID=A0A5M6ICF6_9PROT|nr:phenylacetic acid degradation protein PaaY [Roseospira marina]KAA5605657.1 phenylacetic acid degradation protein PaaY [Roseospira marina]MBB4313267.1 carbonic anhydrase/acetyltransferase-like protein (isoleucine patch superfamily) [Roseospira marina]MBB5085992.1 carbonic anhydrase/acetyltransferase-like protein (isoleucine patch superfamily) [Roseospira marina]
MPVYAFEDLIPVVHPTAFIHPTAILIGDVQIGAGVYVGPSASLRGDFGRILLEEGSNIQDNCTMHGFQNTDTVVEADGHIGHGAILHSARVGRGALVGMNSVVMDGAVIGPESIVAAQCFVKAGSTFGPRSLIAGVPGKVIRAVTDAEFAWKTEGTRQYQDLAQRCRRGLRVVEPLTEPEPDRPTVQWADLKPLYQSRG